MSVPIIDFARFPVVVITYGRSGTLEEVELFMQQVDALYGRGAPFATVNDTRLFDFLKSTPAVRKAIADGANALLKRHPGVKVAEATVVNSAPARAANTAINLLRQRPFATASFTEVDDAVRWAAEQMQKHSARTP